MAKELMEIGGFITSGAEIVNHDASLSGNGTVDSPLGVVPGYNETVLWSGEATSGTFTEDISGFDRLKVLYVWNPFTNNKAKYVELQATPQTFSYLDNGRADNTYNWFAWGSWNITNSGFALIKGFQSVGNLNSTAESTAPRMYKVIGINRKAQ